MYTTHQYFGTPEASNYMMRYMYLLSMPVLKLCGPGVIVDLQITTAGCPNPHPPCAEYPRIDDGTG